MLKRYAFLTVMLLVAVAVNAQVWTKPVPQSTSFVAGTELYLYNVGAEGFYLGANDWSTRASFSVRRGYKVVFDKYLDSENNWDGESYYLVAYIEDGAPAGQNLCLYISNASAYSNILDGVWVDQAKDGSNDKLLRVLDQTDGTYRIGLSSANTLFRGSELPDVYLCAIPSKGDTKLYFTSADDYADLQDTWQMVTPEAYANYLAAFAAYESGTLLGKDIAEAQAKFPSVDISAIIAVYNNTASTAAELDAARTQLAALLVDNASPTAAVNMTYNIVNPDYIENNNTGWTGSTPGFQTFNNAEFYNTNYDYKQQITGLKAGVYAVGVTAFYRAGWAGNDEQAADELAEQGSSTKQNARLVASTSSLAQVDEPLPFACSGATDETLGNDRISTAYGNIPNNMATAAAYFAAGLYEPTSVVTYTADGDLTLGLNKQTQLDGDWTIFSNWTLYYLGNSDESLQYLQQKRLEAYPAYPSLVESSAIIVGQAEYANYKAAYDSFTNATTAADIVAALPAYEEQSKLMKANADAYAAYYEKYAEAENFLTLHQADLMGEGMELLGEYIWGNEPPSADYPHPNGSGLYIIENGSLTTEQIAAETEYIQKLMDDALAGGMVDGMDSTGLIKNPHFEAADGWTKEGLPEYPLGSGDYKLAQAYSILFNVHQELTGLQNGLYELTLNDLFRPANFGAAEYAIEPRAYVYMNGFEAKLNTIESGATETNENGHTYEIAGIGYVPNTVDEAATSFQAGNYKQTLYGLVTDGTLKLGIRNDLRYEGCWAVWSDLHLTFRAKNPEVLAEVISNTLPVAQELTNNKCGADELAELAAAHAAAETVEGEESYDAMVRLKEAMDAVEQCTETYVNLSEALENLEQAIAENPTAKDIDAANALLGEGQDAYANGTWNNATATDKLDEIGAMTVAIKLGDNLGEEQDVSNLIVNNNFDPAKGDKGSQTVQGWETSSFNNYKEYTLSYNRSGIDLYQDLTGLPKGHYKVTVHTYYRAGYWNEEESLAKAGGETHLTTLYASTSAGRAEVKVKNLYEDAQPTDLGVKCYTLGNGLFAPDGTTPTAKFFAEGYYLNELEFDVPADGKVRIGLSKTETLPNDYEVVGEWNLYFYPEIREDYTSLIVNNNFDPAKGDKGSQTVQGWETSSFNNYKEYTLSYNRSGIDLYQDLTGLPAGKYEVTVHTYYRAGYWNEEESLAKAGGETHLTTLYASTSDDRFETKVMNLYEDAQPTDLGVKCYTLGNGLYAPDGTTPTAKFFAEGYYLNALQFTVPEDGKARIGLLKTETLPNDYEVVGEWNLYYLGKGATGINELRDDAADTQRTAVEFYDLSGRRLLRPQSGINIVRMSDGSTRKVFMK